MPVAAVVATVAAGAIGAKVQSDAAKKAGKTAANAQLQAGQTQADAANRATDLQRQIYQDQRGIYAPTATLGAGALARQSIMAGGDPNAARTFYSDQTRALNGTPGTDAGLEGYDSNSWMTTDPGYAFRRDQGAKALERSAAARGQLFSGATGMALQRYGQDYASNEFQNAFNRLGTIAGQGQDATGNIGNAASGYADSASQSIMAAGSALAAGQRGAGQARASGYAASGDAWGNFWNDTVPGAFGYANGAGFGQSGGVRNSGAPSNRMPTFGGGSNGWVFN